MKVVSTPEELAAAMAIRRRVFVEEQGIPADLDEDGLDSSAVHVLVCDGKQPVATGRLVIDTRNEGVLARIAVLPSHRGGGLGRRVVRELESLARRRGLTALSLQPHRYLERFYADLGYETVAGTSIVGGHELITMRKSLG
jgi:predicted GNAT family N-acyltransferase